VSTVFTIPQIAIDLDGVPLGDADVSALEEVVVRRELSLPAQCQLTFVEPRGSMRDTALLLVGAMLRVRIGEHPAFDGQITAVESQYGPSRRLEVRLRSYDLLHRLRKRQPVRAHVDVTAADLARELAADLGVALIVDDPGPIWRRVMQAGQSDLDLLVEVAERSGLYVTLHDRTLHLITLAGAGEPLPLVFGELLLEVRIEVNSDRACRSVIVSGWDPARVEPHQARVSAPRTARAVAASATPATVGGSDDRTLAGIVAADDRQAEAMAQAELDRRSAAEVTVTGTSEGDVRLMPGARVALGGVAMSAAGTYVLTQVTHRIDRRAGFVTTFSTAPPPRRARAAYATLAWGTVTRIDDPDGLGRVRVALPAFAGIETEWMGVVAAGAGSGKGLVALPDVGDYVLVLFQGDERSEGLVLGGLYGVNGPPDYGIESGVVRRRTLLTPAGHKLLIDDGTGAIRLEDAKGSYLELSAQKIVLHGNTDVTIEAPGRAVVIRGASVDFQRG
jgi:phage protein D/phage baseplate assembly protein gpV